MITIEDVWAEYYSIYKGMALAKNRLPFYRNWGIGDFRDLATGKLMGGFTAFFVDRRINPDGGYFDRSAIEQAGANPRCKPCAYRGGAYQDERIIMTELFRPSDLDQVLEQYEEPKVDEQESDVLPELRIRSADSLIGRLGYLIHRGPIAAVEGRIVHVPRHLDSRDADVEAVRLVCQMEWAKADEGGNLGAEMTFGLIACELQLDCSQMCIPRVLRSEIADMKSRHFVTDSIKASYVAGRLIERAFLEVGKREYQAHFDALKDGTIEAEANQMVAA